MLHNLAGATIQIANLVKYRMAMKIAVSLLMKDNLKS